MCGKIATRRTALCKRRKIRPQRRAVSLRRCQKTAADIVNSDAVSERSAKRVPPRTVLLRRQDGQRGGDIARRGEQDMSQNSTASWRGNISAVAVRLCDELLYASHEILVRSAFKI